MTATAGTERRRSGFSVLRGMLFWLVAALALGETPVSLDDAFSLTGERSSTAYGQTGATESDENPSSSGTIAVELAAPQHVTLTVLATETGENPFGLGQDIGLVVAGGPAPAMGPADAGIARAVHRGFQSQAPPTFA